MHHQKLIQQAINIGIVLFLLAGCNSPAASTSLPSTSTPLLPISTPIPPTPTPKPTRTPGPSTPTEAPAFVQTVKGGESINVAAPMLALVLPWPGEFSGEVSRDNAIIGISLGSGQDHTAEITIGPTSIAQEPTDIVMTWGEESFFFGVAEFEYDIEVPVFLDASTGIAIIGWKEAFLSMVKGDRRLLLRGTLKMPIIDPGSKKILYELEYQFEENASISWDQDSQRLVWSNMKVTKLPAP